MVLRREAGDYNRWFEGAADKKICRDYGISDSQYYKWRDEVLEGMKKGLQDKWQKDWWDQS